MSGSIDIRQNEWLQRREYLARHIVDSAFHVHRELGPGLLEVVYETCMLYALSKRGINVRRQVPVPITFDGDTLDATLRLDLLVEDMVIVEIKAVETLIPLHQAQLLTYLRLSQRTLGFLINFNVELIKDGLRRLII